MTTRANREPAPDMTGPSHQPLPVDARDDFGRGFSGPCYQSSHYAVLPTNQIGELQIHPCDTCQRCFVYSDEFGWLTLRGEGVKKRADEIIDEAVDSGVFKPGTRLLGGGGR